MHGVANIDGNTRHIIVGPHLEFLERLQLALSTGLIHNGIDLGIHSSGIPAIGLGIAARGEQGIGHGTSNSQLGGVVVQSNIPALTGTQGAAKLRGLNGNELHIDVDLLQLVLNDLAKGGVGSIVQQLEGQDVALAVGPTVLPVWPTWWA